MNAPRWDVEVRVEFTAEQERLIWEGWRAGESFQQVGARVGQSAHIMQYFQRPALLAVVKTKLLLGWSPEQVSAWLRLAYPDDESMRISHEAIYRSIY